MSLHCVTGGSGPDLVLVHGWGLHGGIWGEFATLLEAQFRVWRIDLPGHGASAWSGEHSLQAMAAALLAAAPAHAAWLGWSLGGLVALQATLHSPGRVKALVLLASTPCFVRRPGWEAALAPELLESFAQELRQDYARTLNRFLGLQVRGSERAAEVLRALHVQLLARGEPDPAALQAGLEILRESDLRSAAAGLECPVLAVAGERDTLVPAAAVRASAALLPAGRAEVVPGAGHAPFIARPQSVAGLVQGFLTDTPVRGGSQRRHG